MMTRVRPRGEEIRGFILQQIQAHPAEIARIAAEHFDVSRQAINVHLHRLVDEGALEPTGNTRNRTYRLASLVEWHEYYPIVPDLEEHLVWSRDVVAVLGAQPENVMDIWQYGFTEMFNNARDHSEGQFIGVHIERTAVTTEMRINDNGVGIFRKIQKEMNLLDERHAVFELVKGKLTTDPRHHTGEGIFFTSRMFDAFDILSAGVYFSHEFGKPWDWVAERKKPEEARTTVYLKLNNHTSRTITKVFDQFSSGDEYGFNKTIVPVRLAQYGNDKLISRSQAKRVVARIDLFKAAVFDFQDVPTIGQPFADEIFRVFASYHPEIDIHTIHANSEVQRMIARAKAGLANDEGNGSSTAVK
jgi:anti-sigma regulatory factor (Ser/Thr protein kinase)